MRNPYLKQFLTWLVLYKEQNLKESVSSDIVFAPDHTGVPLRSAVLLYYEDLIHE